MASDLALGSSKDEVEVVLACVDGQTERSALILELLPLGVVYLGLVILVRVQLIMRSRINSAIPNIPDISCIIPREDAPKAVNTNGLA